MFGYWLFSIGANFPKWCIDFSRNFPDSEIHDPNNDVFNNVQRPLVDDQDTNTTDYQSFTNSINRQPSFTSQGTFQAANDLVRADHCIEEGPQLDAFYNTNFEHEVQSSQEEVGHKGNARTTFYQHEVEQHAYNPMKMGEINSTTTNPPINDRLQEKSLEPEFKVETDKGANDFKPKPLPKMSCTVCGNKQYPLGNNLVSLPHVDHYFVKERKEIKPSHYLAKLVLRHQYQSRYKQLYVHILLAHNLYKFVPL